MTADMSAPFSNCSLDVRGYPIEAVLALLAPYHPTTVAWHARVHGGVDQLCLVDHVTAPAETAGVFVLPAPMPTVAMAPIVGAWLADPNRKYPENRYSDAWERKTCRLWTDSWGHGYLGWVSFVTIEPFTGLLGK